MQIHMDVMLDGEIEFSFVLNIEEAEQQIEFLQTCIRNLRTRRNLNKEGCHGTAN
jgi:hypothetical protein